jgi:thiol-disulfide isomerase/thioredoxin
MRLVLFIILLSFTCTNLFSQKLLPFSIKGKNISDTLSGKMYLRYETNGKGNLDSCQIRNGQFNFSGNILHPVFAILSNNYATINLFIEPKPMTLLFKDSELKKVELLGSNSDYEYRKIEKQFSTINERWKVVLDTLDAISLRDITQFQELKDWVLLPYFEEFRETYLDFFEKHPQSFVTAYYLSLNVIEMNQGIFSTDTLQAYYNRFRTPLKKSWYGKKIIEELTNRKVAVPGKEALNFTKTDLKGQPLSLSSFRGKYVLLEFWGSWCVPCRKGNPHLKELYYYYKDKGFDIIGIAKDDDTKDAWIKAVVKDGLPWHQILVGDLDTKYNISSYPTKILIDQQGLIIGRFGEDENKLDEKLKSIFNSK